MIVCHSFFYKAHPRYLDKAVGLMEKANNNAFATPDDWQSFLKIIRRELDKVNSPERGLRLSVVEGQIQIETKGGLDYAARLNYFTLKDLLMWNEVAGDFFGQADREGGES